MDQNDEVVLVDLWNRGTSQLNEAVDEAYKQAQNEGYELGLKRGKELAAVIAESVAQQSATAETMNYDTTTAYHVAWKIRHS